MMQTSDHLNLSSLLPLDAAPASMIDGTMQIRSQVRLEQILALPGKPNPGSPSSSQRGSGKARILRWAAIPVLAGAALAIPVLLPSHDALTPAQALTTWQPIPVDDANVDLAAADAACISAIEGLIGNEDWGMVETRPDLGSEPIFLETRGDWDTVAYIGQNNEFTSCLLWTQPGQPPTVAVVQTNARDAFSETGWGLYLNEDFGFDGVESIVGNAKWDELPAADGAQFIQGTQGISITDDSGFSYVIGRVGSDVVELVLHTYTAGDVVVAIRDGWYSAWWPRPFGGPSHCMSAIFEDGTRKTWGCNIADTMTLTLTDGSSHTVRFDSPENLHNDEWGTKSG